jgi:hypothetical protein
MANRPGFSPESNRWMDEVLSRRPPLTPRQLAVIRDAIREADENIAAAEAAERAASEECRFLMGVAMTP